MKALYLTMPHKLFRHMTTSPFWINIWRVAFILTTFIVIWQSLRPASLQGGAPYADKVMHFLAYAIVAALGLLGRFTKSSLWIVIFVILLGGVIEYLQGSMQLGRTASFADMVANMSGVCFAYWVWGKAFR